MSGRLKVDEIATLTGYSVSTVSRVLSGKSYTSEKAREAIIKCARQLGVLDEMVSGRLLINGLLIFAPERTFTARGDIFYHEVTRGVAEALANHDVYLSYCGLEEQRADIKSFIEKANNKNINAIILIGIDDPTILKLATTLNKPCVLINSLDREMKLDAVSPDYRTIGYNTVRHLFEQGHRRILTLTWLSRFTLRLRLEGIKDAYRQFNVPFNSDHDLIVTEGYSPEETEQALEEWFASHPRESWPHVIYPVSASVLLGVQRVLARLGLRVPQDISLMTNDYDKLMETIPQKPVSGFSVPCHELGSEAVYLLQNRLNRPNAPVFNLLLQGKFIEAGSIANATRHAARGELSNE